MKSLLHVPALLLPLLLTGVSSQAAPRIDPRGAVLIDREIARLKSLKSYSVTGTETLRSGQVTRTTKLRLSLQVPLRAAVHTEVVGSSAVTLRSNSHVLLGPSQLLTSTDKTPARVQAVTSGQQREQALLTALGSVPSVAFCFLAFGEGINPIREKSTVSVRVAPIRMGKTTLQNVIIQQRSSQAGQPLETYEYGFGKDGLRRFSARRALNGEATLLAQFEAVKSNWKGSQAATDAAVYKWATVAPGVPIRKTVAPKTDIAPQARALFSRATRLYAGSKTLHLVWKHSDEDTEETETRELRLDRDGLLFLKGNFVMFTVAAIDGKTSIEYDGDLNLYTQTTLPPSQAAEEVNSQLDFTSVVDEGLSFFQGSSPLASEYGSQALGYETLRATVLPSQPFMGQACDLVRLSVGKRDEENNSFSTEQQTFWFARSDGRLVRWQSQTIKNGETSDKADNQVTLQEFAPKFEAKDFKFEIPKGATKED